MAGCIVHSTFGEFTLIAHEGALVGLRFGAFPEEPAEEISLLQEATRQLAMYFHGELRGFDLPLRPQGTAFQRRVWQALREIPYGQTVCYAEIAKQVGCPKGMRAVGLANNRNPLPIFIPCHRVIGKDGSLVGYGGGLWMKERLLALEKTVENKGESV